MWQINHRKTSIQKDRNFRVKTVHEKNNKPICLRPGCAKHKEIRKLQTSNTVPIPHQEQDELMCSEKVRSRTAPDVAPAKLPRIMADIACGRLIIGRHAFRKIAISE
jgi:hypothetical protein